VNTLPDEAKFSARKEENQFYATLLHSLDGAPTQLPPFSKLSAPETL